MTKLFDLTVTKEKSIYHGKKITAYAELDVITSKEADGSEMPIPDFNNIQIKEHTENGDIDFIMTGKSWSGKTYDYEDVCTTTVSCLTRQDTTEFEITNVCKELQDVIDVYLHTIIVAGGFSVPKKILHNWDMTVYELSLMTDKYAYYIGGDLILMTDITNNSVVSDNYFAEVGYGDSVENIKNGTETLLYGELPEE
mgnify:CR=1 FL=1